MGTMFSGRGANTDTTATEGGRGRTSYEDRDSARGAPTAPATRAPAGADTRTPDEVRARGAARPALTPEQAAAVEAAARAAYMAKAQKCKEEIDKACAPSTGEKVAEAAQGLGRLAVGIAGALGGIDRDSARVIVGADQTVTAARAVAKQLTDPDLRKVVRESCEGVDEGDINAIWRRSQCNDRR